MFSAAATGHALIGLVTGLQVGDNALRAATQDTNPSLNARLDIRNFPIYGPIFSGPHQVPWICETDTSGLGPSQDEHCTVPVRYEWFYRTTAGDVPAAPEADAPVSRRPRADDDHRRPHRQLHRPRGVGHDRPVDLPHRDHRRPHRADRESVGARAGRSRGRGGTASSAFPSGAAAAPPTARAATPSPPPSRTIPLSLGFAVAFGTRNTLGNGCDDVVSAETLMMIKERFIEQYGVPRFTIGSGGSGGSIQQHLIAHNYPGLLDALTPGISYPDVASILPDIARLRHPEQLLHQVADPANWPGSRRAQVDGYASPPRAHGVQNGWGGLRRRAG